MTFVDTDDEMVRRLVEGLVLVLGVGEGAVVEAVDEEWMRRHRRKIDTSP